MSNHRILVLGASGMLGNAMMRVLSEDPSLEVVGSIRTAQAPELAGLGSNTRYLCNLDAENYDALIAAVDELRPNTIINCIGLIKQRAEAEDVLATLPINSLLPHRLARLASCVDARVIHFSTDCVFSGKAGNYRECDFADATDLYGKSKYLGELQYSNCFTVRTSIIGHELKTQRSLIGWFLSQTGRVKGFANAIFSGLPTVELSRVVRDFILPREDLSGLWHVSADPINKFDLLTLVADIYGKDIEIQSDDTLVIDRSLDSSRFREATGYRPPDWPQLIRLMHAYQQ